MSNYVTTPIFYVNAEPHLGHAYTAIAADAYCRFQRLRGHEVRLQTGTDEHGDKIAAAAAAAGITPQAYADRVSALFKDMAGPLGIAFDHFIRTTDPDHRRVVQGALTRLHDQGDIVLSDYSGLYCRGCERFLTEKELVDGLCPDHRTPPDPLSEQNYFFKMSRYQDWLIDHIRQHPEFITPERYKNEVLSFLSEPLEDLCISRPISRLTWGIPLPFDHNFVTYVWFDALLNYLSGIGYDPAAGGSAGDFARFWPRAEHVVAKDILKPHAIYWPTMLRALGLAPYWRLHVHGYWNVNDTKMSKSIGNVVRPLELVADYGTDAVRYFLLREMSFGLDAAFSREAMEARYNSDLANDLGNLVSRTLAMAQKFTAGAVPEVGEEDGQLDRELVAAVGRLGQEFDLRLAEFQFHRALQAVWEVIGLANRYIVINAPWELAKDQGRRGRLALVIYNLLEALRHIALALGPVMPETARLMLTALGLGGVDAQGTLGQWGGVLRPGALVKLTAPLFPRREKRPEATSLPAGPVAAAPSPPQEAQAKGPPVADQSGLIDFDYFKQLDLRVATVLAAEPVKKSDRLLKLTVAAPEPRTVVAGIAGHYSPEEVVGRQVIIVANLKPTKLMGIESQGMVLAAKDGDRLLVSAVAGEVTPGVRVS